MMGRIISYQTDLSYAAKTTTLSVLRPAYSVGTREREESCCMLSWPLLHGPSPLPYLRSSFSKGFKKDGDL